MSAAELGGSGRIQRCAQQCARKLVLSSQRPGFAEAQALAAIRDFMAEHGKRPTADSWTAAGMRPSQTTIRNRFGSFREAIEAALHG